MTDSPRPASLFKELKRRRVFRVAIVYVVAALALIEAADLVFPRLALPDWTVTLVVALAVLGFPAAIALAWAFDIGPAGVVRSEGWKTSAGATPRRSAMAWAGAGAIGAIVLVGGYATWAGSDHALPDQPGSENTIAVFPFAIRGSPDLEYLGDGMVNLLTTKMDGAGDLRAVDARALLSRLAATTGATDDPAVAANTARHFGAARLVMGDIVQGGDRLRVTATLYRVDPRGVRRIAEGIAEGTSDSVFDLVDEVAAQLLAEAAPGPGGRTRRIAAVTTSSLPAFRSYVLGEITFREGRYGEAIDALENAVALDSTFALAWYRLSLAYEYRALGPEAQHAAIRALDNAGRLADRDRRMLEAFMAWRAGNSYEAERLYRAHVSSYPDDVEAWFQLGEVLFHLNPMRGRSFLEAEDAFRRVLEYEPGHDAALIHLVRIAYAKSDLAAMDSLAAIREAGGGSDRALETRALQAFAHDDSATIATVLRNLRSASDGDVAFTLWVVGTYGANIDAAEAIAGVMTRPEASSELRGAGRVARAYLRMGRGRWRDAMAEMDAAHRLDPTYALEHRALLALVPFAPATPDDFRRLRADLRAMDASMLDRRAANRHSTFAGHDGLHRLIRVYLLGLIAVELGDQAAADSLSGTMATFDRDLREAGFMKSNLLADFEAYFRARTLLARGRPADAMVELESLSLVALYPHYFSFFETQALERWSIAETLVALGRHEEAVPRYVNIVGNSPLELVFLAPAHLRQAEIHERAGRRDEAVYHYRAFLELWSDPDPELAPLRDRARAALAALRTASPPGGE